MKHLWGNVCRAYGVKSCVKLLVVMVSPLREEFFFFLVIQLTGESIFTCDMKEVKVKFEISGIGKYFIKKVGYNFNTRLLNLIIGF